MFYNLSNHPHSTWCENQIECAKKWGEIEDVSFPPVNGSSSEKEVLDFAKEYVEKLHLTKDDAIMVVGEYTFIFSVIDKLLDLGINVVSSKSKVNVENFKNPDGSLGRNINFTFLDFIPYQRYTCESDGLVSSDLTSCQKKNIFLNCSFHYRSSEWGDAEKKAVDECVFCGQKNKQETEHATIIDFPLTPFSECEEDRNLVIEKYLKEIAKISPRVILLDGQFDTFFTMADLLMKKGYKIVVKCSNRNVTEVKNPDGSSTKTTEYRFIKYRELSRLK